MCVRVNVHTYVCTFRCLAACVCVCSVCVRYFEGGSFSTSLENVRLFVCALQCVFGRAYDVSVLSQNTVYTQENLIVLQNTH